MHTQATEGVRPVGRRDFRRLRHFEAYSRLFAQEDNTAKETFAEFDREAVREQLHGYAWPRGAAS